MTNLTNFIFTWAIFMGLIQADGTFTLNVRNEPTPRIEFRVTMSMGYELNDLIQSVIDFLKQQGIDASKQVFEPNIQTNTVRGTNVSFTDPKHITIFLNAVANVDYSLKGDKGISFLDRKGVEFYLFKRLFELYYSKGDWRPVAWCVKTLFSKSRVNSNFLSEDEVARRLQLEITPELLLLRTKLEEEAKQHVANDFKLALKSASVLGHGLVTGQLQSVNTQVNDYPAAEFLQGLWEGDGSHQVNIVTHLTKDGKPIMFPPKKDGSSRGERKQVEFESAITLTDADDGISYSQKDLYQFCATVFNFEKGKPIGWIAETWTGYHPGKGASRFIVKSKKKLQTTVDPFFKIFPMLTKRKQRRFEIMSESLDISNATKDAVLCLVEKLYEPPFEKDSCSKPVEKVKELVEVMFQNQETYTKKRGRKPKPF